MYAQFAHWPAPKKVITLGIQSSNPAIENEQQLTIDEALTCETCIEAWKSAMHQHQQVHDSPKSRDSFQLNLRKKFDRFWVDWIMSTSLHGPLETYKSRYFIEKLFWICIVIVMLVWTMFTMGKMMKTYFSEKENWDTEALSPSDIRVFDYLSIAYCSSDWLDVEKAKDMGMDERMIEYMNILLEVVTGDGLSALKDNIKNPLIREAYHRRFQRLVDFNRNSGYSYLRQLYEAVAQNYSSIATKRKLCPAVKGNFCNYTYYPQTTNGYTIRGGRVCQYLVPEPDKEANNDPLQKDNKVMFAVEHRRTNKTNRVLVSLQPYIGELVTTGLGKNTDLFGDHINFTGNTKHCNVKIEVSTYEINRINTSHSKCMKFAGTRQPGYYPALTCKLKCVDRVYYVHRLNCSIYYPLYKHDDTDNTPLCSSQKLHDAMSQALGNYTTLDYTKCVHDNNCEAQVPCSEYFGTLEVLFQTCSLANEWQNTTKLIIEVLPSNIIRIKYGLALQFTEMYSSIGGVMGLAVGGSLISLIHLVGSTLKSFVILRTPKPTP